jgi:uncharacterized membrane protein (UPF0127 family)
MRNLFLSLFGVAVFIFIVGLISQTYQGKQTILTPYLQHKNITLKEITIGQTHVMVTIADTDITRSHGLSNVTSLAKNEGMLFMFPQPGIYTFWMKDMKFALDFIWVNNGKVVQIDANIPAPDINTPDNQLKLYKSKFPVDSVLEVNAGFALKSNIKVGDKVSK